MQTEMNASVSLTKMTLQIVTHTDAAVNLWSKFAFSPWALSNKQELQEEPVWDDSSE